MPDWLSTELMIVTAFSPFVLGSIAALVRLWTKVYTMDVKVIALESSSSSTLSRMDELDDKVDDRMDNIKRDIDNKIDGLKRDNDVKFSGIARDLNQLIGLVQGQK